MKILNKREGYIGAIFVRRLNRFVARVDLDGRVVKVYVPNTGRMLELVIPGSRVILVPSMGRYKYKIRYIFYKDHPVMIDSVYSNALFKGFLRAGRVPGLEEFTYLRSEPQYKNHRFDFLLADNKGENYFLELKSCTLAWKNISAFPDAVSSRASSHIEMLAEAGNGILLFLIFHKKIDYFIPNYHTDFHFYRTLKEYGNKIRIFACSVDVDESLAISKLDSVKVLIPEIEPQGAYLLVLRNDRGRKIDVGKLGPVRFKKGFYIYTGSGKKNLFKRINHHKKGGSARHWHMDYIKPEMKIIADIPIVSTIVSECGLADDISRISGASIDRFGSSDCGCGSHLFYFKINPLEEEAFWDFVLEKRYMINI